jgi:hypothetical protein
VKTLARSRLNKTLGILGIFILTLGIFGSFYAGAYFFVSPRNYAVHRQLQQLVVDHPEFIPTAASVRFTSAGFDALIADLYWLGAIQYIGGNAIGAEYKQYL